MQAAVVATHGWRNPKALHTLGRESRGSNSWEIQKTRLASVGVDPGIPWLCGWRNRAFRGRGEDVGAETTNELDGFEDWLKAKDYAAFAATRNRWIQPMMDLKIIFGFVKEDISENGGDWNRVLDIRRLASTAHVEEERASM